MTRINLLNIVFLATESPQDLQHKKIINIISRLLVLAKRQHVGNMSTNITPNFARTINREDSTKLSILTNPAKITVSKEIETAIKNSDAVIAEASLSDLALGIHIASSINFHKLTLILAKNGNLHDLDGLYNLPDSKYLHLRKYTESTQLASLINDFLKSVEKQELSERLNLMVTSEQKAHLKNATQLKNTTVSDYLRDLIERDMPK